MSLPGQELTEKQQQQLLNPNKAARFNEGKVELSYLLDAPLAMEGLCRRFSLGAKKYNRDNWKKGLPEDELIDALMRHLMKLHNGEYYDEDGGTHPDAIVWNAVVLAEQLHRKNIKPKEGVNDKAENFIYRPRNCS